MDDDSTARAQSLTRPEGLGLISPRTAVRLAIRDKAERGIYVAGLSIPAGLVMAAWKIGLTVVSPSLFLAANALFTLGAVGAKHVAVRAHFIAKRMPREEAVRQQRMRRRAYRWVGAVLTGLSLAYVASCLLIVLGPQDTEPVPEIVAIAIATVAFTELVIAVRGILVARRSKDLLTEGIRQVNLAGALVLIVLTQTALTSLDAGPQTAFFNGVAGVLFGSGAAGIGTYMLVRTIDPELASRPVARES